MTSKKPEFEPGDELTSIKWIDSKKLDKGCGYGGSALNGQ